LPSLDHRRSRQRSITTLGLASALLLATCGPIAVAASRTEASERKQKLEERRDVNANAERDAHELRVQIDELQAEAVDRGLLVTLDDAVFTTNDASLSSSGHRRLDTLAEFLKQHPERSVVIDGYAGEGNYRYDQALSKRRVDAVKAHLIRREIAPSRLNARTSSEALPEQDEDSATAPQPRRVEVTIEDPSASVTRSM
jgi:outer membrane protein OmpA-like peptidoglycan-associated protein